MLSVFQMDPLWSTENIKALQCLLRNPEDDDADFDPEDKHPSAMARMKPSDIGPRKAKKSEAKGDTNERKKNPDDIWDIDEIPEGTQFEDIYDPRPQPEYELFYKQSVTKYHQWVK
ncbi:hypothetical protein FGIG_11967 [Fasciola gigantica]|uniref:Uncharacterized protein n=1 Tax=Fasciola gigantica TaxID=46835 RepID=A0A504Z3S8_FASGI|nr:hypothetical protein FGIG_11967 [Fasciola gigantica]